MRAKAWQWVLLCIFGMWDAPFVIAKPLESTSTYGVGFAVGEKAAFSLQKRPLAGQIWGWHSLLHFDPEEGFLWAYDGQRHFRLFKASPDFLQIQVSMYTGLGLSAASLQKERREEYLLRWPFGLECSSKSSDLVAFAEAVGLLGPVPKTSFGQSGFLGVRFVL